MLDYAVSIKYMFTGYAVIFIILAVYLASLFIRWKRLNHDLQTLENLEEQK